MQLMTENGGILMSFSINISHSGYQHGSTGNEAYRVAGSGFSFYLLNSDPPGVKDRYVIWRKQG